MIQSWQTTTPLYDHQQRAVEKLRAARVGGLFMEMGTGKTRAAIELAWLRRERIDHVVWFCPVSLKETIRYEIEKHAPGAAVCVFDERTTSANLPTACWYIIGIESMSSSDRVTLAVNTLITEATMVVVDESGYIKNHRARRTERITLLAERARYRLLLTGTPVSEGPVDLYSQMRFLSPLILGYKSFWSFAANHLVYESGSGRIVRTLNAAHLAKRVQPYVYQVTKAECLDLPPKLHEGRYFTMTEQQYYAYGQAKEEILFSLESDERISETVIYRLFGALQQVVCGFWNRRDPMTDQVEPMSFPHRRIKALLDVVRDVPANEKMVIWSKYHFSIGQIVDALRQEYGPGATAEFHGRLSEQARHEELSRWRATTAGAPRFLIATQAAGGHGLTLNEAGHVVFYSNEFSYAKRLQAEDRCHRIGQTRPVTYVTLTCRHSIDERIASALERKADAAAEFRRQVHQMRDEKSILKEIIRAL